MTLKILIALAIILVVLAVIVALRPSDFHVARSETIVAPPERVFTQINDLHAYAVWNPWGKYDPAMKTTFEGPRSGVGAAFAWEGNSQVGAGRMTITESRPNELVRVRLDFLRPFPSTATAEFTLNATGRATVTTWSMIGRQTFIPKAIGLFLNMDKMVGREFEKGLAQLKSIAESSSK